MREKTLAEIQDENEEIRKGIKDGFDAINLRLDRFEQSFVRKDLYETRHQFLQTTVSNLQTAMQLEIARMQAAALLEIQRLERKSDDNTRAIEDMKASYGKKMWALATGILFPTIVGLLIILFTNGAFS